MHALTGHGRCKGLQFIDFALFGGGCLFELMFVVVVHLCSHSCLSGCFALEKL